MQPRPVCDRNYGFDKDPVKDRESYAPLERLMHRIAFGGIEVQKVLADLEDRLFASRLHPIAASRPVFVTSLPRAGTTLFLQLLNALPDFTSHTYRNMPFVLCPLFWALLSHRGRRAGDLKERVHGDGILISYDSPEAFEEILWKAFWPEHYRSDRIEPWTKMDRNDEFEHFFRSHISKILALASSGQANGQRPRYVSKNNSNIARLELLEMLFPECRIIVPIRNPWDHIASLRRQHERFLAIHAESSFGLRYMEWLGHFEFGAALRPIDFGGWLNGVSDSNPRHEVFWQTYWAEAYEAISTAAGPNTHFIDYDRACKDPESTLEALAVLLDLEDPSGLISQAFQFRHPTPRREVPEESGTRHGKRVSHVYRKILAKAI